MKEQYRQVAFTDMTRSPRGVEVGEKVQTMAALVLTPEGLGQRLALIQDLEDYLAHCSWGLTARLTPVARLILNDSQERFGIVRGVFSEDESGYFLRVHAFVDQTPQLLASMPDGLMKGGV